MVKDIEYSVGLFNEVPEGKNELFSFTKDTPYFTDLTFCKYEFENKEHIKGYTTFKINKIIQLYHIYIQWDYQNPV